MKVKQPRRRPGQRATASNVWTAGGYDLSQDKAIRARARFEGTSIGAVVEKLKAFPQKLSAFPASAGESFVASERFNCVPNTKLSSAERVLLLQQDSICVEEYAGILPVMQEAIRSAALDVVADELVRARRARHTGNVLSYVAELERNPRYLRLEVRAEQLPF
ncbi:hypothetical protein QS306_11575 [Paraburkholderia bonniea]|uniref:hypothetical protein n=1 Tax=Paraburkholderia bonniea TaxID=2152891 RepID=UPI0025741714|nr:hypothetical protein [Paraburkholderia bonniea]WJF89737.1 hypothetical protein QS306_11575 [Paraburkholderia bonniea]WJF93051.1 hypothetical protein QS308_11585 [Paraburkholderia bonniea]